MLCFDYNKYTYFNRSVCYIYFFFSAVICERQTNDDVIEKGVRQLFDNNNNERGREAKEMIEKRKRL